MNKIKRFGALFLALVMILALSVPALEAQTETPKYAKDATTDVTISSNSFTIPKDIVVYNTDAETIYEPNITYKYTLQNVTPGTSPNYTLITDDKAITTYDNDAEKSVTAVVKAGITGGIKVSSNYTTEASTDSALLKFGQETTETVAATATNNESVPILTSGTETTGLKKITRNLTVTVDPTAFKKDEVLTPGVYRYKIIETAAETEYPLAESGVTRTSTYSTNLMDVVYLDIYLKWTDDTKTALEFYGAVLFHSRDGLNGFKYTADSSDVSKVSGFDVKSQGNDVDTYHTWNLTVKKSVTGGMGDKNHKFPFNVAFSESAAKTAQFRAVADTNANGTNQALALTSGALNINSELATATLAIKDSGKVVYYGIPTDVKVLIKEKNDTVDFYTASAKNNKHTGTEAYTLVNNASPVVTATNVPITPSTGTAANNTVFQMIEATTANVTGNKYQSNEVTFTNNLDAVSPTGVVLRVAPYVLMLAAGIVLLVLSRKRKKTVDAA